MSHYDSDKASLWGRALEEMEWKADQRRRVAWRAILLFMLVAIAAFLVMWISLELPSLWVQGRAQAAQGAVPHALRPLEATDVQSAVERGLEQALRNHRLLYGQ